MKLKLLSAIFSLIFFYSCKEQKKQTSPNVPATKTETNASEVNRKAESIECFGYAKAGDTIFLSIRNKKDNFLEGDLVYALNEKDKNRGNIYGHWKGDSLFADYEFTSEGITSVREVFFLKTDSGMIEGHAPVAVRNSKTVFSNHNFSLNNKIILKRTDCR